MLITNVKQKPFLQKALWTLILLWVCYVPEVKLDKQHTYAKSGFLKLSGSRNGSYHIFNGKTVCESMNAFGCNSGFRRNDELAKVDDGKTPIELIFAPNIGNALWKSPLVIEIRKDGDPISGYTTYEMLNHMHSLSTRYLFSLIIFAIFFPIILYPKLFRIFNRN
jgi:hypothetical protein